MELPILLADKLTSWAAAVIISSVSCTECGEPSFVFWSMVIMHHQPSQPPENFRYKLDPFVDAGQIHMEQSWQDMVNDLLLEESWQVEISARRYQPERVDELLRLWIRSPSFSYLDKRQVLAIEGRKWLVQNGGN